MSLTFTLVNRTLRGVTRLLCRVEDADLAKVPPRGPLIIVSNHINFLEVPLVYSHLVPRPVTGFAKAETWHNPLMAWLFDLWGAIPIRRGESDVDAMRRALAALEQGKILAVAPEGTRSGHGRLQRGHPGVVVLALRSGAPLLPLAYFGGERFHDNIKRLQRTDFRIVVGEHFTLGAGGVRLTRAVRQQMADEVMYQLAALLPPAYRGYYADLERATERFLRFPHPGRSNLASLRSGARGSATVLSPAR